MLRYVCSFTVKVISHPDNSTSFEVIESQLENPLIDADHHDLAAMKQIPVPGGHHHKTQHKRNQTDDRNREYLAFLQRALINDENSLINCRQSI